MSKRTCGSCVHVSTPKKGHTCYTLIRILKDIKGDFIPQNVIHVMDEWARKCNRYKEKREKGCKVVSLKDFGLGD